jgi:hypothetical protein
MLVDMPQLCLYTSESNPIFFIVVVVYKHPRFLPGMFIYFGMNTVLILQRSPSDKSLAHRESLTKRYFILIDGDTLPCPAITNTLWHWRRAAS